MLKEIVIAFQSWSEAHRFIQQHKLWKWIVIPGIIYTILFVLGMYFFWASADDAISWVSERLGIENWLQQKRSEWLSFFFVMMGMMLRLGTCPFFTFLFLNTLS
ncbi:MAG: EI24 domain-containing protein [Bacteroidota bacterium]